MERTPRARRIRTTKENMRSTVRTIVEDDDFRAGYRDLFGFAIATAAGTSGLPEVKERSDSRGKRRRIKLRDGFSGES